MPAGIRAGNFAPPFEIVLSRPVYISGETIDFGYCSESYAPGPEDGCVKQLVEIIFI